MKKAAFRFKSGSGAILAFLILALVFATIVGVVYVVIAKNPGKTPFAQTMPPYPSTTPLSSPAPSLPVNWNMPAGYVSFSDTGNKKANCQSASTTCSTAPYTYWPNSPVTYFVRVNSMSGPVLQNGTTIATPDGRAVANWNWRYEVNVFPDSLGSCVAAGAKCVKGQASSNMFVANNLLPATLYRLIVCAPACVGGMVIQNTTARTADVAASWILKQPIVSGSGVSFGFSPASNGLISLVVKASGAVVFDSGLIANGQTSIQRVMQSGNYTAVLTFSTLEVSNTVSFSVSGINPTPTPPAIVCFQVDFDHDGSVTVLDLALMSKANGTKVGDPNYNKAYDLNFDGAINTLDLSIASKFFGQKCPPINPM